MGLAQTGTSFCSKQQIQNALDKMSHVLTTTLTGASGMII